jgi:hypothetical protein
MDTSRRARGFRDYFIALGNGEPVAIGITVVLILGIAFAAVCWMIDQKKKEDAEKKKRRKTGGR